MASYTSDEELRQRLRAAGIDAGPITNETRELYIRALRKRAEKNGKIARKPSQKRSLNTEKQQNQANLSSRPVKRKMSSGSDKEPAIGTKRFKYGGLVGQANFTTSSNNSSGVTLLTDSDMSDSDDDDCFVAEASPSPPSPPRGLGQPSAAAQTSMLTTFADSLQTFGSGVKKFVRRSFGNGSIMKAAALLSPAPAVPSPSPSPEKRYGHSSGMQVVTQKPVPSYDWELFPGDVQICCRSDGSKWFLGRGGCGEVFKAIKDGVDEVAVKVMKMATPQAVAQFKQEIDTISSLRHKHILQFYGACVQPTCLYMVTELMTTDLYSALRREPKYFWTGQYGPKVAMGIASGIHYLHSRCPQIVHRDIKSPNILLVEGLAKIADVGLARSKANSDMTAQRGFTVAWAAPEVVYRRRATEKIDIWSFGVILWEIASGSVPHVGQLVMPKTSPIHIQHLYSLCTSDDPTKRPPANEIIRRLNGSQ